MELSLARDKWEDHSSTTLELEVELGKYSKNCFITFAFCIYRWVELVFNPRNQFEQKVGEVMRFFHPYLAFITYRFHVEKAREIGKSTCIHQNLPLPIVLQLIFIFNII
jgi:hypothetical protein